MRVVQPAGGKGSLKWIQRAVAERPDLLQPEGLETIRWVSPLAEDDFAEYRDGAFLERIGLGRMKPELADFWPARGPQWDALGLAGDAPILVEAKASLRELVSPPTQAGPASLLQIEAAFVAVQGALGIAGGPDWTGTYYQLANRIAHLWWLRSKGVAAHLLLVDFIGDAEVGGPMSGSDWDRAFEVAESALGLARSHALSPFIHHLRPHVGSLG